MRQPARQVPGDERAGEDRAADADRPIAGPNAPNALPSSSGGKMDLMMPKPCGISIAPNRPCATRAPISIAGRGGEPAQRGRRDEADSPTRNIRRRP